MTFAVFRLEENMFQSLDWMDQNCIGPFLKCLGPCDQSKLIQGESISTRTDCHNFVSVLFRFLSVKKLKTDLLNCFCLEDFSVIIQPCIFFEKHQMRFKKKNFCKWIVKAKEDFVWIIFLVVISILVDGILIQSAAGYNCVKQRQSRLVLWWVTILICQFLVMVFWMRLYTDALGAALAATVWISL